MPFSSSPFSPLRLLNASLPDIFIARVLFPAFHTLINEFFHFFSFRPHTFLLQFPLGDYHGPFPSLARQSRSLLLILLFFSRQSRTVTTIHPSRRARFNFSHSAILFHSRALPRSSGCLFRPRVNAPTLSPLPRVSSLNPSATPSRTRSPSRTLCSRSCMREQNPR